MMQALEEGRREDALALFDAFQLEGATISQVKELLILFKSRLRTDLSILTISTAAECRQCCEHLFDVYEARTQINHDIGQNVTSKHIIVNRSRLSKRLLMLI